MKKSRLINKIVSKLYLFIFIFIKKFLKSRTNPIKLFQYKKILNLFNTTNKKQLLEFGSGNSTVYFAKKINKNCSITSINPKEEIKYSDICRKKLAEHKIDNVKILNTETEVIDIENKKMVSFKYQFNSNYDLVYIDGPSNKLGTNLIYNFYNNEINTKIICIDGRIEMTKLIKNSLLKNKIEFEHHIFSFHNMNVFIIDKNLFFLNNS